MKEKNFKIVSTGELVDFGDTIAILKRAVIIPNSEKITFKTIKLSKDNVKELLEDKIIESVNNNKKDNIDVQKKLLYSYINKSFERIGLNVANKEHYKIIDNFIMYNTAAFVLMVLKEIALALDNKYEDHILKEKNLWSISPLNLKIYPVKDNCVWKDEDRRSLPLFRNLENAQYAIDLIKCLFDE